jgi:hypothetical protein
MLRSRDNAAAPKRGAMPSLHAQKVSALCVTQALHESLCTDHFQPNRLPGSPQRIKTQPLQSPPFPQTGSPTCEFDPRSS